MANLLPAWHATEPDIGGTIADALNSLYRRAQFLERVLGFLKTLGGLAPPCAVVPLSKARDELVSEAAEIRSTLLPAVEPGIREPIGKSLDALDAQIAKIPTDVVVWTDAPGQWKEGAWESATSVPTSGLGKPSGPMGSAWDDVLSAAESLAHVGGIAWLITVGPVGAVVAGVLYRGSMGEELSRYFLSQTTSAAPTLKSALQRVLASALRFENTTKKSVYQQVLGVWMLARSSSTPEIMQAGMTGMNPYLLPPMPETWDGSFEHLSGQQTGESASWLIALLVGGFIGLSVAALTE